MAPSTVNHFHPDLPHVESISRILKLPIVEDGTQIAGNVYNRIKRSNTLMSWGFYTAERSFMVATTLATPAINIFNGPITAIDHLLCKGIDVVEEKVPAVHLPSRQMYCSAKDYMASKIKPVLSRAENMTQIGSIVANVTAERLNDALISVEKHIDDYLPDDPSDKVDNVNVAMNVGNPTRTIILSDVCIRKIMKLLKHLMKNFEDIMKLILTNPEEALKELCDWTRFNVLGDDIKVDTLQQSFVLLLKDARAYIKNKGHEINVTMQKKVEEIADIVQRRIQEVAFTIDHRTKEIVDTITMFPVLVYAKIHPLVLYSERFRKNFKKHLMPVAILVERIHVYVSFKMNNLGWFIRDCLCHLIYQFFEWMSFFSSCVKGLMNLIHIPYEVNPYQKDIIIQASKTMYSKIEKWLDEITKVIFGERCTFEKIQGPYHQQNGIE